MTAEFEQQEFWPLSEAEIKIKYKHDAKALHQAIKEGRSRGLAYSPIFEVAISDEQSGEGNQTNILLTDKRLIPRNKFGPILISIGWKTNQVDHDFSTTIKNPVTHEAATGPDAISQIEKFIGIIFNPPEATNN